MKFGRAPTTCKIRKSDSFVFMLTEFPRADLPSNRAMQNVIREEAVVHIGCNPNSRQKFRRKSGAGNAVGTELLFTAHYPSSLEILRE
jgi:hypothetical protein